MLTHFLKTVKTMKGELAQKDKTEGIFTIFNRLFDFLANKFSFLIITSQCNFRNFAAEKYVL